MRIQLKQCGKGHFFLSDQEKCPYCYGSDVRTEGQEAFVREDVPLVADDMRTEPPEEYTSTISVAPTGDEIEDYESTKPEGMRGNYFNPRGDSWCDPVVGWLVGITGPNRGRSYRLHSGTNFIGRSAKMDVFIENDSLISHENAASISYDDRAKQFFIEHGAVRNAIYVNGEIVREDADINMYDRIVIGGSEFVFVPLCGEEFDWKKF